MKFELKVFKNDRAEPVAEAHPASRELGEKMHADLVKTHRLGEHLYTPDPGVHIYENGTIHARAY